MMFQSILTLLGILVLIASLPSLKQLEDRSRRRLGLAMIGLSSIFLMLTASMAAQPIAIDMDLLVPFVLKSGDVAMTTVTIGDGRDKELLLVPTVVRVPMGSLPLWSALILSIVLMVLPAIRGLEEQRVFVRLHGLPILLVLGTTLALLWTVSAGFQAPLFEAYLREFDLRYRDCD